MVEDEVAVSIIGVEDEDVVLTLGTETPPRLSVLETRPPPTTEESLSALLWISKANFSTSAARSILESIKDVTIVVLTHSCCSTIALLRTPLPFSCNKTSVVTSTKSASSWVASKSKKLSSSSLWI